MKTLRVRDPITGEPIGLLLTTNPDLWPELEEPPPPRQEHGHDDTSWADLYGVGED